MSPSRCRPPFRWQPPKFCVVCRRRLTERQTRFHSKECQNRYFYQQHREKAEGYCLGCGAYTLRRYLDRQYCRGCFEHQADPQWCAEERARLKVAAEAVSLLYDREFDNDLEEVLAPLDYPVDSFHVAAARFLGLNLCYPRGRKLEPVRGSRLLKKLCESRRERTESAHIEWIGQKATRFSLSPG